MKPFKQYFTENNNIRIQEEIYKVASIGGKALADYIVKMDEIGLLQRVLPEVYAMKGMLHDPKHHPEGGPFSHVLSALKYSRSKDPIVNLAVLFHDIGKTATYVPQKEHKGRVRIHTYDGHDVAGTKIIETIGRRLKMPNADIDAIKFAAYRHMVLHNPERLKPSKLAALVNHPYWHVLKEVSYCDEMSRGDQDKAIIAKKFDDIEQNTQQTLGSGPELKKKVKDLIDGTKLLNWIPELNERENRPMIGNVLKQVTEYIIDNNLFNITEDEVRSLALKIFSQNLS